MGTKCFTNAREMQTFLRTNLGTVDVTVDPSYWGDEEDAVLDMMDSVIQAAKHQASTLVSMARSRT